MLGFSALTYIQHTYKIVGLAVFCLLCLYKARNYFLHKIFYSVTFLARRRKSNDTVGKKAITSDRILRMHRFKKKHFYSAIKSVSTII